MSQYIGKTISLISNSNIRYIGTLHEINSEQSTVSLKQVRSFGTEGRRGGQSEIPPSENVYEFIVFRGSDVKDLKIAEEPVAPPPPPPPFADAAIMNTGPHVAHPAPYGFPAYGYPGQAFPYQQPSMPVQQNAAPAASAAPAPTAPAPTGPKQMQAQPAVPRPVQPSMPVQSSAQVSATSIVPALPIAATAGGPSASRLTERRADTQTNGFKQPEAPKQPQQFQQSQQQQSKSAQPQVNPAHSQQRMQRAGTQTSTTKAPQPKLGNDYDFQQNNAKFVQDESKQSVIPAIEEVYNKKSSFFDNLSTTAAQKDQMTSYERRDEEHKLNLETFGQAQIHHRRGGGRGRGGRGYRGRGGYRGNFGRGGNQMNQRS